jgi:hypothetical protein
MALLVWLGVAAAQQPPAPPRSSAGIAAPTDVQAQQAALGTDPVTIAQFVQTAIRIVVRAGDQDVALDRVSIAPGGSAAVSIVRRANGFALTAAR